MDFELLGVALVRAGHHVVEEGTGGSPESSHFLVAEQRLIDRDLDAAVLFDDSDLGAMGEGERALGALHIHGAVCDRDLDALGHADWFLADS